MVVPLVEKTEVCLKDGKVGSVGCGFPASLHPQEIPGLFA